MQILISKDAQKQFDRLSRSQQIKILRKIKVLGQNPYAGKKLEAGFKNFRSLRAWPYRIIYFINQKEKRVEVSDILHRQGAY